MHWHCQRITNKHAPQRAAHAVSFIKGHSIHDGILTLIEKVLFIKQSLVTLFTV
ncbi:hypothetical protein [Candidatus Methylopumilus planktonicus]|uniref:hypothetical protein n=1 Tax=Candidatus Methylopumilus planktonicus TaxID=1581557 RepID=UPI0016753E83|nr:hypothetical protein [Candidatus Methylopumilus planktonicus]